MTSVRRSLTFRVQRAGHAPITLRLMAHAAPAALAVVGDTLRFELPDGDHLYLVSKEDPRFPVPPAATALPLEAERGYELRAEVELRGGHASLWVIEYDDAARLQHAQVTLRSGTTPLRFTTDPRHRTCCVALRLAGRGELTLRGLTLLDEAEAAADAAAHAVAAPFDPGITPSLAALGDAVAHGVVAGPVPVPRGGLLPVHGRAIDPEFELLQLELLWQRGLLWGLDGGDAEVPGAILDWAERRGVLLACDAPDAARRPWFEAEVLARRAPVIVRGAVDPAWASRAPQLRGVADADLAALTAEIAARRRRALDDRAGLAFPRVPERPEDVVAQGFEIVAPTAMPTDEKQQAEGFWSQHVSPFYTRPKPWGAVVAEVVRGVGATSVLEFGCHAGRNLAAIQAACPDVRLTGLDINPEAVRAGHDRWGLDLRVSGDDTLAGIADDAYDLVFTVSVLDHIPDITGVCRDLLRIARRAAFFLEVTLPVEGKVVHHFDHKLGAVRRSTDASYSWFVDRFLPSPPVHRVDDRPYYLHAASLGPYYHGYLAWLEPPPAS